MANLGRSIIFHQQLDTRHLTEAYEFVVVVFAWGVIFSARLQVKHATFIRYLFIR